MEVNSLEAKLFQESMSHIKVVGLNERKFLLRTKSGRRMGGVGTRKAKGLVQEN